MDLRVTRRFALLGAAGIGAVLAGWGLSRPASKFDSTHRLQVHRLMECICGGRALGLRESDLFRIYEESADSLTRYLEESAAYVPELVSDVGLALQYVEYAPVIGPKRSRFSSLSLAERQELLRGWMTSESSLERDVWMALKTLCTFMFYEHPQVRVLTDSPLGGSES